MAKLSREKLKARSQENGARADRIAARVKGEDDIRALQALSPPLPTDHRLEELEDPRARVLVEGAGHPVNCECQRCMTKAEVERGPLRKVLKVLTDREAASFGKGTPVLLDCGHQGERRGRSPRVRCPACRSLAGCPAAAVIRQKTGPLRRISRVLKKQKGCSAPATVLLECDHEGTSWGEVAVKARCRTCELEGRK